MAKTELISGHRGKLDKLHELKEEAKEKFDELLEAGDEACEKLQEGVEHYWNAPGNELKAFEVME